jgi:hypothetical protein
MSIRRTLAKYVEDCRTFPQDAARAYGYEGWRGVWDTLATGAFTDSFAAAAW